MVTMNSATIKSTLIARGAELVTSFPVNIENSRRLVTLTFETTAAEIDTFLGFTGHDVDAFSVRL